MSLVKCFSYLYCLNYAFFVDNYFTVLCAKTTGFSAITTGFSQITTGFTVKGTVDQYESIQQYFHFLTFSGSCQGAVFTTFIF